MSVGRILIVSEHMARGYSGGRYHSWIMAEAIAAGGREVVVWTNTVPFLMRDFVDFPAHDRIELFIDPGFRGCPTGRFEAVVVVPSLALDWSAAAAGLSYADSHALPLVFLDFEAPGWYNAGNAVKRPWYRVFPWFFTARHADVVLSTTRLGSQQAREYYDPLAGDRAFTNCYCAINSFAADAAVAEKRDRIICITRLDSATPHKGATDLLSLMCEELRGYELVVIGSIPAETKARFETAAAAHGMSFSARTGLTDLEKFAEIKASRLMVFLSHFEGFGLPPLEALYCGTPCLVRPLPVLRETGGPLFHYLQPDEPLPDAVLRVLAATRNDDRSEGYARAREVVGFAAHVDRITALLDEVGSRQRITPPAHFAIAAFVALARMNGTVIRLLRKARSRK